MADDKSLAARRRILESLYQLHQRAPLASQTLSPEPGDTEHVNVVREARYLLERNLVSGSIGGDGWGSLRLTPDGRDYVEAGGFWAREPEPQTREAAVRRLGLENLHPRVLGASSDLFTDGHYAAAIFAAFRTVEMRVRELSGLDATGKDLMARAFNGSPPPISVKVEAGVSGENEQEGFRFLFMGAIVGIRNPKGHEDVEQEDPNRALEYLAFASLLMRRLDGATLARPLDR